MNYEEMSDFEINKAVAEHFYDTDWLDRHATHAGMIPDYCNNPSDAWPIIFRNDIMLNPNCANSLWKAEQGFRFKPSGFYRVATAYSNNPLRAAMIVFLMMKDAECLKP